MTKLESFAIYFRNIILGVEGYTFENAKLYYGEEYQAFTSYIEYLKATALYYELVIEKSRKIVKNVYKMYKNLAVDIGVITSYQYDSEAAKYFLEKTEEFKKQLEKVYNTSITNLEKNLLLDKQRQTFYKASKFSIEKLEKIKLFEEDLKYDINTIDDLNYAIEYEQENGDDRWIKEFNRKHPENSKYNTFADFENIFGVSIDYFRQAYNEGDFDKLFKEKIDE